MCVYFIYIFILLGCLTNYITKSEVHQLRNAGDNQRSHDLWEFLMCNSLYFKCFHNSCCMMSVWW